MPLEDLVSPSDEATLPRGTDGRVGLHAFALVPEQINPETAVPLMLGPGSVVLSLPSSGRGVVALWSFAGDARQPSISVVFRMTSSLDFPQDFALVLYDADGNKLELADEFRTGPGSLERLEARRLRTGRVYHLAVVSQLPVPANSYSVVAELHSAPLSDPIVMDAKTGRVSYSTIATGDLFRAAGDIHFHPLNLMNADREVSLGIQPTLPEGDVQVTVFRLNARSQLRIGDEPVVPRYEVVESGLTSSAGLLSLRVRAPPGSTLSEEQYVIAVAPKGYASRPPSYQIGVTAMLPLLTSTTPDRTELAKALLLGLAPSTELGVAMAEVRRESLDLQTEKFYWIRTPAEGEARIDVEAGFDAVVSIHDESTFVPLVVTTKKESGVFTIRFEAESGGRYYVRVAPRGPVDRQGDEFSVVETARYNWRDIPLAVPADGATSRLHGSAYIGSALVPIFYQLIPDPGVDYVTLQLGGTASNRPRITVQGQGFREEIIADLGGIAVLPIRTLGRPGPLYVSLSSEAGIIFQSFFYHGEMTIPRELPIDSLPGRKMAISTGDVSQPSTPLTNYGDRTGFAYYHLLTKPNEVSRWSVTADPEVVPLLARYVGERGVLKLQDWVVADATGSAVMERKLTSDRLFGMVVLKLGMQRGGNVALKADNPVPFPVGVGMVPDLVYENRPEYQFGSIGSPFQANVPPGTGIEAMRYGYILKIEPITLEHDYEQDLWETILPENFFNGNAAEDPAWPVIRLGPETPGSSLQLRLTVLNEDGGPLRRIDNTVIGPFTAEAGQPLFVNFSELGVMRVGLIGAKLQFRVEAVQGQLGNGVYSLRMTVRTTNPHPFEVTESAWTFSGQEPVKYAPGDDAKKRVLPPGTPITDVIQNQFGEGSVVGAFSGSGVGVDVYRFWTPGGPLRVWTSPAGSDPANTSIKLYRARFIVETEAERLNWWTDVDYLGELRAGNTSVTSSNDWFQADRSEIDSQIIITDPDLAVYRESFVGDRSNLPFLPADRELTPGGYYFCAVVKNEQGSQGQYRLHVETGDLPLVEKVGVRLPQRPSDAENGSVFNYDVELVENYRDFLGYLPIQLPERHSGYLNVTGEALADWRFSLYDRLGNRLESGGGSNDPPITRSFAVPDGPQIVYLRIQELAGGVSDSRATLRLETTLTADAGLTSTFSGLNADALAQRLLPTDPFGNLGGSGLADAVSLDAIGKVYRFSAPAGRLTVNVELAAGSNISALWGLYAHGRLLAWDKAIPGDASSQTTELWLPEAVLPGGPGNNFSSDPRHPIVLFVKHASAGVQAAQYRITVNTHTGAAGGVQSAGSTAVPLPIGALEVGTGSNLNVGERWLRFVVPDGHAGAMVISGLPLNSVHYPLRYDLYDDSGSTLIASGIRQEPGDVNVQTLSQVEGGKAYLLRFTGRDQALSFPVRFVYNLAKEAKNGNRFEYSVPGPMSGATGTPVYYDVRANPTVVGDFEVTADFSGKNDFWVVHDVGNAGPAHFTVTAKGADNLRLTVYPAPTTSGERYTVREVDYMNEAHLSNSADGKRLVLDTFLEAGIYYIQVSRSNSAGGTLVLEAETPEYDVEQLVIDPNSGDTSREHLGIVDGSDLGTRFFKAQTPAGSQGEATFEAVDLIHTDGGPANSLLRKARMVVTEVNSRIVQTGGLVFALSRRLDLTSVDAEKAAIETPGKADPFSDYLIGIHGEGFTSTRNEYGSIGIRANFDVPSSGTPDLVVEKVELHPNAGQTRVEITIRNRGYATAASNQARFTYPSIDPDDPVVAELSEGALGPLARRVRVLDWVDPVSPEDVTEYAVDVGNEIEEVSNTNNSKSVAMKSVNAHRPTLAVGLAGGRDGNSDSGVWGRYVSSLGHSSAKVTGDIVLDSLDADDAANTYDDGPEVYELLVDSPLSNGSWIENTHLVLEDVALSGLSPTSASNPNRFSAYVRDRFGLRSREFVRTIEVVPFPTWLIGGDSELSFNPAENHYDIEFLVRPVNYSKTLSQMLGISVPFVGGWKNEFIVEARAYGTASLDPDAPAPTLIPEVSMRLVAMDQEIFDQTFSPGSGLGAGVSVHGQVNLDAQSLEATTLELGFDLNHYYLGSFEGPEIPIFGFDAAVVSAAVQAQVLGSAYADAAVTLTFDLTNGGAPLGLVSPTFVGLDLSLELRFEGELEVLGFDIASVGGGFIFTLKPRFGLEKTSNPVPLADFLDAACFELSATLGGELSADVLGVEVYAVEFESDPINFTDCNVAEQALASPAPRHSVTHSVASALAAPPQVRLTAHLPLGTDLIGAAASRPSPQLVVQAVTGDQLFTYLDYTIVDGKPSSPTLMFARGNDAGFGAPVPLASSEFIARPLLAATNDATGLPAVVVYQATPLPDAATTRNAFFAGQDLKYRYYDGNTWSEELVLTNDANLDMQASVAFNASGKGVVAWVKNTTETPFAANGELQSSRNEVYRAIWNPTTHRFGTPVRISSQSNNDSRPTAFVAANGTYTVAYINSSLGILVESSTGGAWGGSRVLLTGVPVGTIREVALGSETSGRFNLVISYQVKPVAGQRTPAFILNRTGTLAELAVQKPWEIVAETGGISSLRTLTAPDGSLHVSWHERRGTFSDVVAVRRPVNAASVAWAAPVRLTQSTGDERAPSVAVASDGTYRVAFERGSRFFATTDGKPAPQDGPLLATPAGSRELLGSNRVRLGPEFAFTRPLTFVGYASDRIVGDFNKPVQAASVLPTRSTVLAGTLAFAETEVINTGSRSAEVLIEFLRGTDDAQAVVLKSETARISPGSTYQVRFGFPVREGLNQMTVRLTPANGSVESFSSKNNSASAELRGVADFAVENLTISRGTFMDQAVLTYTIWNRSGVDYNGPVAIATFWNDPAKPGSRIEIPIARPSSDLSIPAQGTVSQRATVLLDRPGVWLLGVEVRPETPEITLGNNVAFAAVVLRPAVGLIPLGSEIRERGPVETAPIEVQLNARTNAGTASVVVTNTGSLPLRSFELKLQHWVDGDKPLEVFNQIIDVNLRPGASSAPVVIPVRALAGVNHYRATVGLPIKELLGPGTREGDTTDNTAETRVFVQGLPDVTVQAIRSSVAGHGCDKVIGENS